MGHLMEKVSGSTMIIRVVRLVTLQVLRLLIFHRNFFPLFFRLNGRFIPLWTLLQPLYLMMSQLLIMHNHRLVFLLDGAGG